jgi:hypothetical protein
MSVSPGAQRDQDEEDERMARFEKDKEIKNGELEKVM